VAVIRGAGGTAPTWKTIRPKQGHPTHIDLQFMAAQHRTSPGRTTLTLPPGVSLDETSASVEPDAAPDPTVGRNMDQHRAVRDD
jgi:hypothetical protein